MDLDARAVIAFTLVVVMSLIGFSAMFLEWPLEDILSILAVFTPFVSAAVAFYFGQKDESKRIDLEKARIALQQEMVKKFKT